MSFVTTLRNDENLGAHASRVLLLKSKNKQASRLRSQGLSEENMKREMKRSHIVGLVSLLMLGLMSLISRQGSIARSHAPAISQAGCVPAPSGLVAWWPGDGNADDVGGGNNGTLVNGATFAAGMVDQGFSLDGINDHVRVGHNPNLNLAQFTLDTWIKSTQQVGTVGIIWSKNPMGLGFNDPFLLGIDTDGRAAGRVGKGDGMTEVHVFTDIPVNDNQLYHLALTFDGSTLRLYRDGNLTDSQSIPFALLANTQDVIIGRWASVAVHHYRGSIDELSIYNRALTASEIQAIYNASSAGKCKPGANQPPEATCQDVTVSAGATCTANASINNGSFDPDGDPITLSQSPPGPYSLGTTMVTPTVEDDNGVTDTCTAIVTVVDSTPPMISCPPAITVGTNNACTYVGPIGSATASDNCDASVTVSNNAPAAFPLGPTTVTWKATDDAGNMNTCAQGVTVKDMAAPTVSSSVTQSSLWPPNHNLVNVGLSISATDQCDASLMINVTVFGDEDDEEPTGDGTHSPDAKDIAPNTLRVRSERKGDADGRVYLIVVKATDDAGNIGVTCSTVVVPKSQSQADVNAVNAQAASARSFCLANNGAPPPGYVVIGNGPVIGPKQ